MMGWMGRPGRLGVRYLWIMMASGWEEDRYGSTNEAHLCRYEPIIDYIYPTIHARSSSVD